MFKKILNMKILEIKIILFILVPLSADVDTTYITNKYNCTSCLINRLPFIVIFMKDNIFDNIKTSQSINLDNKNIIIT